VVSLGISTAFWNSSAENLPHSRIGRCHAQYGPPGINVSGNTISCASFFAASAISAQALSTLASRFRKIGEACTAAALNTGSVSLILSLL
jgi:hypothetical protein